MLKLEYSYSYCKEGSVAGISDAAGPPAEKEDTDLEESVRIRKVLLARHRLVAWTTPNTGRISYMHIPIVVARGVAHTTPAPQKTPTQRSQTLPLPVGLIRPSSRRCETHAICDDGLRRIVYFTNSISPHDGRLPVIHSMN